MAAHDASGDKDAVAVAAAPVVVCEAAMAARPERATMENFMMLMIEKSQRRNAIGKSRTVMGSRSDRRANAQQREKREQQVKEEEELPRKEGGGRSS